MMFSARAKMSAALDLIMCTLENDALGLQELRSSANPANSAPSEVDKVAEWVGVADLTIASSNLLCLLLADGSETASFTAPKRVTCAKSTPCPPLQLVSHKIHVSSTISGLVRAKVGILARV